MALLEYGMATRIARLDLSMTKEDRDFLELCKMVERGESLSRLIPRVFRQRYGRILNPKRRKK